ncbi:MAG: hypothetical protein AAFU73_23775, partial [Planctomycetota bacterium]
MTLTWTRTAFAVAALTLCASSVEARQGCVQTEIDPTFATVSVSDDGTVELGYVLPSARAAVRDASGVHLLPGSNVQVGAGGLSADGTVAVGNVGFRPARWDGPAFDTLVLLPPQSSGVIGFGQATGVSADGSVLVGQVDSTTVWEEASRWVGGVMEPLGTGLMSNATAVTPDGDTIVGTRNRNYGGPAFVWRAGTGAQDIPGMAVATPTDVSDDGQVVVGMEGLNGILGGALPDAFVWSPTLGLVRPLLHHPLSSRFSAVSPDGSVAYGSMDTATGTVFVAWSEATGIVELDPGGTSDPSAPPMSAAFRGLDPLRGELFVWEGSLGLRVPISPVGVEACVASPRHSGGCRAHARALGSTTVGDNDLRIRAVSMPANVFGFFIAGRTIDPVPLTSSAGPLCLGGPLGRL